MSIFLIFLIALHFTMPVGKDILHHFIQDIKKAIKPLCNQLNVQLLKLTLEV